MTDRYRYMIAYDTDILCIAERNIKISRIFKSKKVGGKTNNTLGR